MMGEENGNNLFRLRWDAQTSALLGQVAILLREEAFIDTTIFTDGKIFKAHRLLLSASSPYLKHILQSVPGEHAALLLPHINATDFANVLKFVYEGEIKICQRELKSFLQVSRLLKIKGMDFDDEYIDEASEPDGTYKQETPPSKQPPKDPLRRSPKPTSTMNNHEERPNSNNNEHYSSHDDDYNDNRAAITEQRRAELEFQKSHHLDYDDHDGIHLEDEEDEPDNSEMLDDSEDCHDDGYPLQPEISMMEVGGDPYAKNQMQSEIQIVSSHSQQGQSPPGSSWGIPHSSTSSNHRGSSNYTKPPLLKKALTRAPGEGILMRMMREPLKSSVSSASQHSLAHAGYEIDETGLGLKQRTKRYVQCNSCSKVLSSLSALKRHMEDVHCARIQGKCLICGRVYSSRNSLLTHVYSAHKKHHDYKAVARIIRESDFETFATS